MFRWWHAALLLLAAGMAYPSLGAEGRRTPSDPSAPVVPASAVGSAEAEPRSPTELRRAPSYAAELERAWRVPAASMAQRADRVRRVAERYGLRSVEPAARVLLARRNDGDPVARVQAAVALAPDLPMARVTLASLLLTHEWDPLGAADAILGAARAVARNLDAGLWFEVTSIRVLVHLLLWGGVLHLIVAGASVFPRAAHDLGDLPSRSLSHDPERADMPGFARVALLAALLALPTVLGEGVFGLVLALLALVCLYGSWRQRGVAIVAALMVLVAAHPLARHAEAALAAVGADPVGRSLYPATLGFPSLGDSIRLERAAASDPLAAEALALNAKREGRLRQADATYQALARASSDPRLLNNAANVRLLLGDVPSAIDLYQRAARGRESPVVLFNLSQAYARAIRFPEHESTLARAQDLDAELIDQLMNSAGPEGYTGTDLPIEVERLRQRLLDAGRRRPGSGSLLAGVSPGPLGRSPLASLAALALMVPVAFGLSRAYRPSRSCDRCGVRLCPRCELKTASQGLCEPCMRLYHRPETTDPGLRAARLTALRVRRARLLRIHTLAGLVIPGTAGILAGSSVLALLGTTLFAATGACVRVLRDPLPDPLTVGPLGTLAFAAAGVLCALAYLTVLGIGIRERRRG